MHEKRKYLRFPIHLDAHLQSAVQAQHRRCSVADICRNGVRLCLQGIDMNVGNRQDIVINVPDGGEPVYCSIEILWVTSSYDGGTKKYICGGRFATINNEDRWRLLDIAFDSWKQRMFPTITAPIVFSSG
ncbi:MAG: PilZ domain-containing protein [Desulfobacterota bacterium]|nr:PilZ domain-containing protein [Thermodesulfobacteriota bacterium]